MATVFTKILNNEIPGTKLYKDDVCFVILDINPVEKGHALVIANEPYENMAATPEDVLQHMICIAKKVDAKLTEVLHCDGTNILVNNNPASGQAVPHLHIHVIPRYTDDGHKFDFPHKSYNDGEMAEFGKKLSL